MSRSLIIVIIVAILLIGGLFLLAGRDTQKAPVTVERAVSLDNLAN